GSQNDMATIRLLNKLENIATIGEKNIENVIEENLEKIKLISTSLQLKIELDKYNNNIDRNKSQVSMNNIINPIKSTNKNFEDIFILDLTGTIVASTNNSAIGKNHANDKLFIQGKLQNDVSIFFKDKNSKIKLYVGSPIIYDGKLIGLVTAIYNLENLLSIFQTYEGLGKTGEFILVQKNDNGDGVLFMNPLRFDSGIAFNLNISKEQINTPTIQSLLKNEKTFIDTLDYRGIPVLAVTRYLESIDWGLVTKIDKLEAFTPLENLKYVTIINGILVGILVIIVSLIIGKSISNPIQKLMVASKNMGQEKFDNPISIIGGSEEIKELSNQLDNMRQNIHYTNNHLNDLVDERTQKLEKAVVELKDKEEALKESNKNLLLVNEKLSLQSKSQMEFVNITAHELRTPIMPIITLTELLYSKIKKENKTQKKSPSKENEKKQEFLEVILRNCYRLYRITEDILDVTKMESQTLILHKEMIELNKIIRNVVNDFNEIINKKRYGSDQVRIVYEPSKDIILVNADKGRLNQLLSNLLDNALKFTKEGNIIIAAKKQKNDEVIVSIKDSGIGINPEILPRLFTKFATKSEHGTGLGLYICKNITEAHGGRMWAEGNPEGGSTFYFTLPIVKSDKIEESEK
ncbi:MAG: sensor histidine kinase, partial [Nitrososphaeraceae archaeon]|nr:sensor histidine kinase [Nitrososphaeraceae archaeon]